MAGQVEEYQRRMADVNTALARHAKVAVEGDFSDAARADMQAQVAMEQHHVTVLKRELESRSVEVTNLHHKLNELARKANLTEVDVKALLGTLISMLFSAALFV